jgi:Lrp/AsnC family leucine-responsive transcriptional regulator
VNNSKLSPRLDTIDKAILKELQKNARISNVDLSKRVNLSPTPCLERVKRLEKSGIILGYHANVCPVKTKTSMLVFIEVTLERTNNEVFKGFADTVKKYSEILECHMIAGGFDYLLKLRFKDIQEYREFLGDGLVSLPKVSLTHTYIVSEEVKDTNYNDLRNI